MGKVDKECQVTSSLNATNTNRHRQQIGHPVSLCEGREHPNWTSYTLITMLFPEKTAASIGLKILWKG